PLHFSERKCLRVLVRMAIGVRDGGAASGIRDQATIDAVIVGIAGYNKDVSLGLFFGLFLSLGAASEKQSRNSGDRSDQTHRALKRNNDRNDGALTRLAVPNDHADRRVKSSLSHSAA